MDRQLLTACAVSTLLGAADCGEAKLDAKQAEKAIKRDVERQDTDAAPVSVTCPTDRRQRKGDTFKCDVRGVRSSQHALATATQIDNKGTVRLLDQCHAGGLPLFASCAESRLDIQEIAAAIKQKVEHEHPEAKPVVVMCPKERQEAKGDTFKCQVKGARRSQRAVATVTQINSKGDVQWVVP